MSRISELLKPVDWRKGLLFLQEPTESGYEVLIAIGAKKGHLIKSYDQIIAFLQKEKLSASDIKGE